ncbi:MAG: NUDIX hydrolase [Acidobacteria bacterium]|nr:NUDIX hydrolase [Acidobacteriota bacterium]
MKKARVISSKRMLTTPIFAVSDNWVKDPQGHKIRRIVVEHGGSAVVMVVNALKQILMVNQYRHPAGEYMWELPAGMIDPGESGLEAAKRELREETGCRARSWKKLLSFYPSPGFQQEKMTIFLARGIVEGDAAPAGEEHLECGWFDERWVRKQIREGKICDAKTIIGYYAWRDLK